ncbi:MAG: DUF1697 domain-containing protein [Pseudomonadota bacterium]|nr:DUF1697 domain-containing protein [Pseudomonadota bacterium]
MALIRRVLLLRGVNVGGAGKLPMAELRAALEGIGAQAPRTLIQSGNAVFEHAEPDAAALAARISAAIEARAGFRPDALVEEAAAFAARLDAPPFPEAEPARLHVFHFVDAGPTAPDAEARLEALRAPSETFALRPFGLVLHAPEGVGRSKLATGAERALGRAVTARNLNTLRKLAALSGA